MNSHTVRPPICLWASTVLWPSGFTVPSAHGETPHMPQGINSICRNRHLPYPNKTMEPPTCIRRPTVLWAPTMALYPPAWATRLRSIRTLSLSIIRPSPSSIKGDALSFNKEVDSSHSRFIRSTKSTSSQSQNHQVWTSSTRLNT